MSLDVSGSSSGCETLPPCYQAVRLEGRKKNGFPFSSVLMRRRPQDPRMLMVIFSHVSLVLSSVFSKICWDCWILDVDVLTAKSVYIMNNNSLTFHQKKKKIIIKIDSKKWFTYFAIPQECGGLLCQVCQDRIIPVHVGSQVPALCSWQTYYKKKFVHCLKLS